MVLLGLFSTHNANAELATYVAGNPYVAEFKMIGRTLLQEMQAIGLSDEELGFSLVSFQVALQEGEPVGRQGLNPDSSLKEIEFDSSEWVSYSVVQKRITVLHGYLGLILNDGDSNFAYSLRTLSLLGKSTTPPPTNPSKPRSGHTYKVSSTQPNGYYSMYVYFDGIEQPSTLFCDSTQRYLTFRFSTGGNWIELNKYSPNCLNLSAYISTANNGADVYFQITPSGFEFY